MKNTIYIVFLFILSISGQSCSKKRLGRDFEGGQIIQVLFEPDKYASLDSYIDEITVIPLETNDNCLIGARLAGVKVYRDLIYINSANQQLLVFDLNGNFIREIGKRGQGPGEFIWINDFIFTNDETIELLDFKKIDSYTLNGKYIGTIKRFDFLGTDFYLNPDKFCRSFSSGYFLWGGVGGLVDERLREKSSMMYRVNSNMQIESEYFDTKYGGGGTSRDRFRYYQDKILLTTSNFDYNIYQINSGDSVSIRYSFDFGKYGFDSSKEDIDLSIANEHYVSGSHFEETGRFLYFMFSYQRRVHSLIYSKATGQSFIQSFVPFNNGNEIRLFPVQAVHNDRLIAIVSVYALKLDLERMSRENIGKWGLEEFYRLDNEDNPVLVIYKTKL